MCEALIALFEALGEMQYLERAIRIAHKLVVELPTKAGCYGYIVEHYTRDWEPDPDKNKHVNPSSEEYIFRPFGFQPGYSFEWAKLLLLIDSHYKKQDWAKNEDIAWILPAAKLLFETACSNGWDIENGGVFYTLDTMVFYLLFQLHPDFRL